MNLFGADIPAPADDAKKPVMIGGKPAPRGWTEPSVYPLTPIRAAALVEARSLTSQVEVSA